MIKLNFPKVNLAARALGPRDVEELKSGGVELIVDESGEMGKKLVNLALNCDIEKGVINEYII